MHLFPKGRYRHLKYDPDNGAPGCPGCHIRLTNDHERHRNFCIQFLGGLEQYDKLRMKSLSKEKVDIDSAIERLERLTNDE